MTVGKYIKRNLEHMLQLRVALALISTLAPEVVLGKNTLLRGSGLACTRVTTVYFSQWYPVYPFQGHMNP